MIPGDIALAKNIATKEGCESPMPIHDNYRQLWLDAGYGSLNEQMSSAAVCPPPSHDFLRVYHFIRPEHALSTISSGRLKVTRFTEANDPYELMALRIGGKAQKLAALGYRELFDKDTGMLCFSRNWSSPVMWSHYSDRHTGICLGFDLSQSLATPVRYESRRVLTKLHKPEDFENLPTENKKLLFSTKFSHWQYESEVRQFVTLSDAIRIGDHYFWPFGVDLVFKEIILGTSCSLKLEDIQKLIGANHPGAITFQARLAIHSFNIVPKEKTVP